MATAGCSRLCLALLSLLLLQSATAASLEWSASVPTLGSADVLKDIQEEVHTMETYLADLLTAIDSSPSTTPASTTTPGASTSTGTATTEPATTEPATTKPATTEPTTTKPATTKPATTEPATTKPATTKPATTKPATTKPTTTKPTTTEPTTTEPATTKPATTEPTTTEPTTTEPATTEPTTTEPAPTKPAPTETTTTEPATTKKSPSKSYPAHQSLDGQSLPLIISRQRLSSVPDASGCDEVQDVNKTLADATKALELVSSYQLSNATRDALRDSNVQLNSTVVCVNHGQIELNDTQRVYLKSSVQKVKTQAVTAADTIDNIVNPPTPEDDSGFKSASIALGVLLALSLVAVAALAFRSHRQRSGGSSGHMN